MLRMREIQVTTDADGHVIPVLDEDGQEIETSLVEVPTSVQVEGANAIEAFVAEAIAVRAAEQLAAIQLAEQQIAAPLTTALE